MAWAFTGPVGRMVAQLGAQMALARLLMPADFGTFATMLLLVTLSGYLSELGGAAQLVRQEHLDEQDISTQLVAQIAIGLLVFVLAAWMSMPVTRFFHVPEAWPMMVAVGANPLLVSLGVVAQRLLSRSQQFRTIQLVNLGSYILGYAGVAILLAWQGLGAWALVAGTLAQSALASLGFVLHQRHAWRLNFQATRWRQQAALGVQAFFSGLLTWGLFSLDRLFVGRLYAPVLTGAYVSAFNLSSAPVWQITSSVQQQLFAKGSRMTDEPAALLRHFEQATLAVVLLVVPAMVGLSLLATPVVDLVLGARWHASAPILAVLALAMPAYVLYGISTPYLWALGRIGWDVGLQLATLCTLAVLMGLAAGNGIAQLTWTVVSVYVARSVAGAFVTLRLLGGCLNHAMALLARLACGVVPAVTALGLARTIEAPVWGFELALALFCMMLTWAACWGLGDVNTRASTRQALAVLGDRLFRTKRSAA